MSSSKSAAYRRFFKNGLLLTATSLILRAWDVFFNARISRTVGADGIGLYTLAATVYGLAVTLAASGVNLAVTRLVAASLGKGGRDLSAVMKRCFLYAAICSGAAGILLYTTASPVAVRLLGDERCASSLRLFAFSLPAIAFSSLLSGYFTAVRRVTVNAANALLEQFFRTVSVSRLLTLFLPRGLEYACLALVGGGVISAFLSLLFSFVCYLFDADAPFRKKNSETPTGLWGKLLEITLPVSAAAWARSALTTVEHILIPRGLKKNPLTADHALASYGLFCGMVLPVIFFPTSFLYSFTGLLVPEFAEAEAKKDGRKISRMSARAIRLTLLYAVACALFFLFFGKKLGVLLYADEEAGRMISLMAPLVPVMYLDHAVDAMLKGLGEQFYSMKINLADAAISVFLVWFLCPRLGISGYILTVYLSEIFNASFSLFRLLSVTGKGRHKKTKAFALKKSPAQGNECL